MPQPVPLLINPKAGSLFRSGLKAWLDDHRDAFRAVPTKSEKTSPTKHASWQKAANPW